MKSIILFIKGSLLGFSMVLPGLSGGTIAFILGIYPKIINEVSKLNKAQMQKIFRSRKNLLLVIKDYDWKFIIPILIGLFASIFVFVSLSLPIIEKFSMEFHALVFGLVLISLYSPYKSLKKTKSHLLILLTSFFINGVIFYFIKDSLFNFSESSVLIFLPSGFLVAIALVVPGISGSYLLILLGLYEKTLQIMKDLEVIAIGFFMIGVVFGLLITVYFVKMLLDKHYDKILSVILGLILGSLIGLWPFSQDISFEKQSFLALCVFIPVLTFLFYLIFHRLFLKRALP